MKRMCRNLGALGAIALMAFHPVEAFAAETIPSIDAARAESSALEEQVNELLVLEGQARGETACLLSQRIKEKIDAHKRQVAVQISKGYEYFDRSMTSEDPNQIFEDTGTRINILTDLSAMAGMSIGLCLAYLKSRGKED